MRYINNERTRVAYRIGNRGMKFDHVAEPGLNEVDDHTADALMDEPHFRRHAAHGFIVVLDQDDNPVRPPRLDEPMDPNGRRPEPMTIAQVHRVVHGRVDAPADQASMPNRQPLELDPADPGVVTNDGVKSLETVAPLVAGDTTQADRDFLAMWASLDAPSREALFPTLDARQQGLTKAPVQEGA